MIGIFTKWHYMAIIFLIAILMTVAKFSAQLDFIAWLQTTSSPFKIRVLQSISDSVSFISFGVPIVFTIAGEFSGAKKKSRVSFLYVALSIGLAGLVSYIFKNITLVPRPYEVDIRITQWSVGGGFSFPSGHTTEAFASATALTFLFPNWKMALPIFTWASLVAFSRIYLGVHYPFDILGGMAIGFSVSFALFQLFKEKSGVFNQKA